MKKWLFAAVPVLATAIVGCNPLVNTIDAQPTLGHGEFETGTRRMADGTYEVSVLTPMPNVTIAMSRWWVADFLQTTEQYKWWHPEDHVWMAWENKQPGEVVGASHLIHEYIGGELQKIRVQFVDPTEFFGYDPNDEKTSAMCAWVGQLDQPINTGKMCHVVYATDTGVEMRTRFWMGHFSKREGNETRFSVFGLIGNTAIARYFAVGEPMAEALMKHAQEEMGYLAKLLPDLYEQKVGAN